MQLVDARQFIAVITWNCILTVISLTLANLFFLSVWLTSDVVLEEILLYLTLTDNFPEPAVPCFLFKNVLGILRKIKYFIFLLSPVSAASLPIYSFVLLRPLHCLNMARREGNRHSDQIQNQSEPNGTLRRDMPRTLGSIGRLISKGISTCASPCYIGYASGWNSCIVFK